MLLNESSGCCAAQNKTSTHTRSTSKSRLTTLKQRAVSSPAAAQTPQALERVNLLPTAPARSLRLEKLSFLHGIRAPGQWTRILWKGASHFTDPGKRQETFGPRHITFKVGRPQLNSPVGASRWEHKALNVHTHPAPWKPQAPGALHGTRVSILESDLSRASRQSNKCHKKDAGETQGLAPLQGGDGVQVWSGAASSARAPRGKKGSAGTFGAPGRPPGQNTSRHSERPGPLGRGHSATKRPQRPRPPHTSSQCAHCPQRLTPPEELSALSGESLRDPWNLEPAGPRTGWGGRGRRKKRHSPPAARTVSGSQIQVSPPAADPCVRI